MNSSTPLARALVARSRSASTNGDAIERLKRRYAGMNIDGRDTTTEATACKGAQPRSFTDSDP
ncbi:MAG: hypothetical protein QM784_23725 [Polyangiaceae bacterium]